MITKKNFSSRKKPAEVTAIIEIPKGLKIKLEFNDLTGRLKFDRFIRQPGPYPFNYGFIPGTRAEDGDHLDIMVLSEKPLESKAKIKARPIGILEMADEQGHDTKILAVLVKDHGDSYMHVNDIKDLDLGAANKIMDFFKLYKKNEPGKWSKVSDFFGREEALKEIRRAGKKRNIVSGKYKIHEK